MKNEFPPEVDRLNDLDSLRRLIKNAEALGRDDIVRAARRKIVLLRTDEYGGDAQAERDSVAALMAFEEAKAAKVGKRRPSTRMWQMFERRGIVPAVAKIVLKPNATDGFKLLEKHGLLEFSFENVVLNHSDQFELEVVKAAQDRLKDS